MNKFFVTLSSTYRQKLKSKAFIITTSLLVLFVFLGANFDKILDLFMGDDDGKTEIVVKGPEKLVTDASELLTTIDEDMVIEKDAKNVLTIQSDELPLQASLKNDDLTSGQVETIELTLNELNRTYVSETVDVSKEDLELLESRAKLTFESDDSAGESDDEFFDSGSAINITVIYAGIMLMFFIIVGYAGQIATEIAQEKSSRVIEMIVSSVSPTSHVLSKVSAIILVAFTQMIIVVVAGITAFNTSSAKDLLTEFDLDVDERTLPIIFFSSVFLVLGLLLYLIFAAMLGSFISRMEDIQQGVMPLTFISIAGFYIGLFNIMSSDSTILKVGSYFPFFTPFTMPVRLLDMDTTFTPMYIGIGILIVSIVLLLLLTTYVYKRNVLMNDSSMFKMIKKMKHT